MVGKIWVTAGLCLALAGCATSRRLEIGARELVPPQRGIYVGSLYYAQEPPTTHLEVPTALELLCDAQPDLTIFGVANPQPEIVADINLLYDTRLQASLSGIQTKLISVGLSGNVSDYYEYKLTKVTKYTISESAAQTVFEGMSQKRACYRALQRQAAFGIYQVKATYVGDIVFQRKQAIGADGSVALKLNQVEPAIKATFSQTLNLGFSGQGLVFSFVPIVRNVPRS
ncbi:hypothetical protein [Xanthobacter oligotrophicus]|uniref:hypothetical protein n=1 Tax=Xanthobacter oligotrophicus TaxID=2607286 RepID=UPI0011F2670C|nr:hypothetical protein [Xanthobacter oligotrophicus]MCG5236827.1 hypothetical protein [Xanthobacter oligotrophicus]